MGGKALASYGAAALVAVVFSFIAIANIAPLGSAATAQTGSAASAPNYAAQWAGYSEEQMAKGQEIYSAVCVSCHGHNLEGATGFRLSDTQWVHGASFAEVKRSILQGFPQKGMPGLAGAYPDEDVDALTAFVLSRQGGWLDHQYQIWALPDGAEPFNPAWLEEKPIDAGVMNQPLPTFVKPEIPAYAMRISGQVLIPQGEPAFIFLQGQRIPFIVEINGKRVKVANRQGGLHFPIAAGQHHLSLTYTTVGSPPNRRGRPLNVFVANKDAEVRKFALTQGAQRALDNTTIKFLAEDGPVVMRRHIAELPAHSIAVGFPDQYNYAFNSRSCSLVGAWQGDFLDIGPNAIGRGQLGAVALGRWLFKQPVAISLGGAPEASCDYRKMSRESADAAPSFHFARDGVDYVLTAEVGLNGLELQVAREDAAGGTVPVTIPAGLEFVSLDNSTDGLARITIE